MATPGRAANGSSSYAGMTRFKFSGVDLSTRVHPGALRQSYGNAPNPPCGAGLHARGAPRPPCTGAGCSMNAAPRIQRHRGKKTLAHRCIRGGIPVDEECCLVASRCASRRPNSMGAMRACSIRRLISSTMSKALPASMVLDDRRDLEEASAKTAARLPDNDRATSWPLAQ